VAALQWRNLDGQRIDCDSTVSEYMSFSSFSRRIRAFADYSSAKSGSRPKAQAKEETKLASAIGLLSVHDPKWGTM